MARKPFSSVTLAMKAVLYLVVAWALGFGFFVLTLPKAKLIETTPKSDGIIVLTGGAGRLEAGLRLLESKVAERMLISGVNPVVEPHELSALTGAEEALFTCCIDLDRAAPNTAGNATESALWANERGYRSFVLVTADYHMPRSLVLFRRAMPGAHFFAHPVEGEWPILYLVHEYNKYMVTLVGEALKGNPASQATSTSSAATTAPGN